MGSYNCSEESALEGSLCFKCKYRVTRMISTEGLELLDEEENLLDSEDMPVIEHEMCSLLHTELDVIILECTGYKPKTAGPKGFFENEDILKN